jgi:hypothetical protein
MGAQERTLSRAELVELLDLHARERFGISAKEMVRRYLENSFDDPGAVSDLMILARLLPEDDELFQAG